MCIFISCRCTVRSGRWLHPGLTLRRGIYRPAHNPRRGRRYSARRILNGTPRYKAPYSCPRSRPGPHPRRNTSSDYPRRWPGRPGISPTLPGSGHCRFPIPERIPEGPHQPGLSVWKPNSTRPHSLFCRSSRSHPLDGSPYGQIPRHGIPLLCRYCGKLHPARSRTSAPAYPDGTRPHRPHCC